MGKSKSTLNILWEGRNAAAYGKEQEASRSK
jgi:hypothetical protein